MKLAIYTQVHENYGAHDWDGRGECPQYWKPKGGEVYVVENLTVEQCLKIGKNGIPHLTEVIECDTLYTREEVMEWTILDDCEIECEDWEIPIVLKWDRTMKLWHATITREREDYWKEGVDGCIETYYLRKNGAKVSYNKQYYGWGVVA